MTVRRNEEQIDTYLLRMLCLLVSERSVSRTALKLNQSQPAVSLALKRLRVILGDPLLVREKGGMVPTERALALLAHAKSALAEIEQMTGAPDAFDPATSRYAFRVGAPDYLSPVFMSTAVARMRREAPGVQLSLQSLGPKVDFERALAEGEMDVVIGNWPEPPHRMHLSMLLEDEVVLLVSRSHPAARRGMTAADFQRAVHVVPIAYSMSQRGVVDTILASQRIQRQERVEVQSFTTAPYLLQGTDLVFTTTRHFAQFYAALLPLAIVPSPIAFPPMRFYLLWHDRNHLNPAHRWMRRLLGDSGRMLRGEPPGTGDPV